MPRPFPGVAAPPREALARRAAGLALAGRSCAPLLPALRRQTVRELLAAPPATPRYSVDAGAALSALAAAAEAAARRPPGWLRCMLPARALPVAAPPRLLQASMLCILRGALAGSGSAAFTGRAAGGSVQLILRGGPVPADAPALLRQLAAAAGGTALYTARPPYTALLRLPLRPDLPVRRTGRPAELLADRYGMLYQFLGPWSAGPDL